MDIHAMRTLWEYGSWARRQVLAAAARVTPEQFIAPTGHSFGSVRATLVHVLDGERAWRMVCLPPHTVEYFRTMKEEEFATVDELGRRWDEEDRAWQEYLAGLGDADLVGLIRYTVPEGVTRVRPLWHCLIQVVNHGTHHRSQAAAILASFGHSPGDLDFTAFLNARAEV